MDYRVLLSLTLCFTLIGMESIETNYLPEDLTDALTLAEGFSNDGYVNKARAQQVANMLHKIKENRHDLASIHVPALKYISVKTSLDFKQSILDEWMNKFNGAFVEDNPTILSTGHVYLINFAQEIDIPAIMTSCKTLSKVMSVGRGALFSAPATNITMTEGEHTFCFTFIKNTGVLHVGPVEHWERKFIFSKATQKCIPLPYDDSSVPHEMTNSLQKPATTLFSIPEEKNES